MATIRTAIELQDNFTSVLYQVINSVNLGLSAMEDLHQSMNAQVDTSSIEAARDSINQATIAVQELDAAMQGVEAACIRTVHIKIINTLCKFDCGAVRDLPQSFHYFRGTVLTVGSEAYGFHVCSLHMRVTDG